MSSFHITQKLQCSKYFSSCTAFKHSNGKSTPLLVTLTSWPNHGSKIVVTALPVGLLEHIAP